MYVTTGNIWKLTQNLYKISGQNREHWQFLYCLLTMWQLMCLELGVLGVCWDVLSVVVETEKDSFNIRMVYVLCIGS